MPIAVGVALVASGLSGLGTATVARAATAGPALSVDVGKARHRISPDIYGMNFADTALAKELGLSLDRWGGNSTSRYNYRNNTSSIASDWYFENIVQDTSLVQFVRRDLHHHTQPVVTVPMTGWVAKRSPSTHPFACGFKTSKYGAQQSTDPYDSDCGDGHQAVTGDNITGNDPRDTSVAAGPSFVKAMVRRLVSLFGPARHGGVRTYELDNEPALWNSTHRDVHPKPVTYNELWRRSSATAAAVKAADRHARVAGPGDWGWCAYFYSAADPDGCSDGPDRKSHHDLAIAAWYLRKFHDYDKKHHTRLLDYFDEHFYPQENGVALAGAGDASTQALRLRSTRTLWDPSYKDESWTSDLGLGPVKLIPRMRAWRNQYYPGTKLSISEYNWGGLESINGALAEADVLGIFGRERLDRALLWSPPASDQPGAFAFRMFRNYDGKGHRFGDIGVSATSADQGRLAVYAAQRSSDGATTVVVINKTGGALSSQLTLKGVRATSAQVFSYSGANLHRIVRKRAAAVRHSVLTHTYPANSLTLFVLPPA